MIKRAYLRSNEGIFTLSPKITIIGRDSCDFMIQNITVDLQQAVIEYFDGENCFILKDLNSTHGTYVNECRIQNASVRLNDGDILKFGFSTGQYEFSSEDYIDGDNDMTTTYTQIPYTQRQSWQTGAMQQQPPLSTSAQITTLPIINYSHPQQLQQRHTVSGLGSWTQLPKTPSTNPRLGRPLSANNLNRRQITPTAPHGSSSSSSTYRRGSVSGPMKQMLPDLRSQLQEDSNIAELQNEIERLRYVENLYQEKSRQMDNVIQQNNDLMSFRDKSMSCDVYDKIKELSDEVSRKCREVDQLNRLLAERNTDNYNRHNSNTSNNEADLSSIRRELDKTHKDLQISNGLVTSLQKDLSNNEEAINKLNRNIEKLNHEITEKDISISALMSKLNRFKDVEEQVEAVETEKQDKERELISLKHKLKAAETSAQEKEQQLGPLTKIVEELQQSEKSNRDVIRDLNAKVEESKGLIADLERSESLLRVDSKESENKYEKFRSKVLHVALSTPGFKAGTNALKDDEIVEIMKDLLKSKVEHDRRICEKQKAIDAEILKQLEMTDSIDKLSKRLKEYSDTLGSGERTSNRILGTINAIKLLKCNETLKPLTKVLLQNFKHEMEFLSTLESCISDAGPELANLTLSDCFKRIIERSIVAVENRAKAESQLATVLETHSEEVQRLQRENDEKIAEAIKNQCSLNDANLQAALDEALKADQQNWKMLSQDYEEKIKEHELTSNKLQEIVSVKDAECHEALKALSEKSKYIEDIEKQLKEVVESKAILEQSLCEQFDTINLKWKREIEAYKEEITQHSITIFSLNERLIRLDNENKDLIEQVTKLRSDKKKKDNRRVLPEAEEANPLMAAEINNFNSTIANLERCISGLRHENVHLKGKNNEYEDTVKGLNMDLAGAEARLSDLKGELSESQKNEIDKLNADIRKLETESTDLQVQLAKMSAIIDSLTQELEDKRIENKNLVQQINEEKLKILEKETKIQDLESNLAFEKENWLHHINQIEQEGRISMELAIVGSQCRGERHVQIIEAQKDALVELRQKMKTIEMTMLPSDLGGLFENAFNTMFQDNSKMVESFDVNVTRKAAQSKMISQFKDNTLDNDNLSVLPKIMKNSNIPEVTQQMLQLKKELAEVRAKQALRDGAPRGVQSLTDMIQSKPTNKKTPTFILPDNDKSIAQNESNKFVKAVNEKSDTVKANKQMKFDLDVAKAAHFDLHQNLEMSESTYFQLVRQLVDALEIDNVKGLRSFDNLSYEAKENLKVEREENCGMIVQKIRIFKEMIQRKDELLHSYETDLVKLKQAEDVSLKTQSQIDRIVQQCRGKCEEIDLLRETLNRTKDLLNQEKRVNSAIKQNKHYVPEKGLGQSKQVPENPKYHCPVEDITGKDKQSERKKSEKLKRKDYEIKSLKSELYNKEKELSHATNRVYTLETTMGIKSEEPVA